MISQIDALMEGASQSLAELDYLTCELLCREALWQARQDEEWVMIQRVLLPLQEARRQKRQAALDGVFFIAPPPCTDLDAWLADLPVGCVVWTQPQDREAIAETWAYMNEMDTAPTSEMLFAKNAPQAKTWQITSLKDQAATALVPAPDNAWLGQRIEPGTREAIAAAHWFMQASEALGNAALDAVTAEPGTLARFDELEAALDAIGDHELLHQALAAAAKALHEAQR